jgi:hypothetical protein
MNIAFKKLTSDSSYKYLLKIMLNFNLKNQKKKRDGGFNQIILMVPKIIINQHAPE